MIQLAALFSGIFVYLTLGAIVGVTPTFLDRGENGGRRRSARAQDWLQQAGAEVTPGQFAAVSLATALVVGFLLWKITGVPALAFIGGGLALWLPKSFYASRRNKISQARIEAWPDAVRDLITHLRASSSVHSALCELGRSGPEPLRLYFNRYAGLAATLDQSMALEVVREEMADPVSDRVIEVILVAFEQGSSVVIDILQDLASATTSDLRLTEAIKTAQMETRIEARGAAILPFLILGILVVTSEEYAEFYGSAAGWLVITFGGLVSLAGLLIIGRLGRIPSEQRILAGGNS